jgi:glycosyltransferase involved in cell wall biosynthesis
MDTEIKPLWIMEAPNHSGMSIATRNLAAGMVRVGCTPVIFARHDGENAYDFQATGCPVRIFPHLGGVLFGGSAIREAEAAGVTLVHALSADLYRKAERIARRLEVPLLITCNRLEENEIRSISRFRGQGVIAVSRAIRERIVNLGGLTQNRIRIIHNGLDLSRFPRPSFTENNALRAYHCPVIGTLGHLSRKKGQRVFLQAVKILLDHGFDAEFVVLGDGPDRVALRGLADELNVTRRVTFTPQTVSGQLNQLDLLVEPSLQEGLGMSVMQAMATGVPVVATGVGGLYDLIEDGVTGIMVPAADAVALADAMHRLLSNSSERIELAKQAREMIEKEFSAELAAQKHVDYYRECVERYSSRRKSDKISVRFRP